MQLRPNLDVLRAFAVLLVVFDHTSFALGYSALGSWGFGWVGVFGVYLFFVHTALVLMWSLERQPHVLNFYIRRAFRIYPLAVVAILIAYATHLPVSPGAGGVFMQRAFSGMDLVKNLLLVQNYASANIVGVTWSLAIEVQMYLLLPALFFYADREKRLWPLLVLWLLACAAAHPLLRSQGNSLITVAADFLPGVMAFVAFAKVRPVLPAWSFLLLVPALLCVFMLRPGPAMAWPITLALGLLLPLFRQTTSAALGKAAHAVAKYSYGIYLSHPFAIALAFHTLAGRSRWLQGGVELAVIVAASVAGYHLIEEPLIRRGSALARANDRWEARRLGAKFEQA